MTPLHSIGSPAVVAAPRPGTPDPEGAGPRVESARHARRFQIFVISAALIYAFGAVFGQNAYVLIAAVLLSYGGREWRRTRGPLPLEITLDLPDLIPAGRPPDLDVRVRARRDVRHVEIRLDLEGVPPDVVPGFVLDRVAGGTEWREAIRLPALERGAHRLVEYAVESGGELGLIFREEIHRDGRILHVHPRPRAPIRSVAPPLEPLEMSTGLLPGPACAHGAGSQLRPFSRGDSLRRIDWRATARLGQIVVLSTRLGPPERVLVVVDTGDARHLEVILETAAHILLFPPDRRRRVLALAGDGPESVRLEETDPVARGLRRLAGARAGRTDACRSFVLRAPRFLPECEIVVVAATMPQLPSVEGHPLGFVVGGAGDRPSTRDAGPAPLAPEAVA